MHSIAILGSTGSIGTQTLDVVAANPGLFRVAALAAYQNDGLLEEQIQKYQPEIAVLVDKQAADRFIRRFRGSTRIVAGEEGLLEAAVCSSADTVLTALVGFAGLRPTLAAIDAGKHIALANKETLVAAGELVMARAKQKNVQILPVDSEHSAILQCLQGESRQSLRRIILTASGGPFRGKTPAELRHVSVADCLKHPNWVMGKKITIDSATLANKGLEVIEAHWLFGLEYDKIDVIVHPQSIVHSMVEFMDGSVIAQMGKADMRLPIQYALTFPERTPAAFSRLDFFQNASLTFEPPDRVSFPALALAYEAGRRGGSMPCVYNAANETAVQALLADKIAFWQIPAVIEKTMAAHPVVTCPNLEDLFWADDWARRAAAGYMEEVV